MMKCEMRFWVYNQYKGFTIKAQRPNIYLYTKTIKHNKKNVINQMSTKDNVIH